MDNSQNQNPPTKPDVSKLKINANYAMIAIVVMILITLIQLVVLTIPIGQ